MAANPLPFEAIEAFSRLHGIRMTPWEIETLELIDDAILAAQADTAPRDPVAQAAHVPINDTKAVGSMLSGIAASRRAAKASRPAKT